MTTIYDLSTPRSQALTDLLRKRIADPNNPRHEGIPFSQFMEAALYHPQFGYYNAESFTLGKEGDFTTASEISPLFAHCFTRPYSDLLVTLPRACLLELGAGTGKFAYHLLRQLAKENKLPDHYYIHEISPRLREKQQHFLRTACPALFSRIHWLDTLPNTFTGMIIANEVLDALPVDCFQIMEEGISERLVAWENQQWVWRLSTNTSPAFNAATQALRAHYALPIGYQSEVHTTLAPFLESLTACLTQGAILFTDYGYGQAAYYHPARKTGTLTCFYHHQHHDNPLVLPGLQDITAHVDFTRVIEIAADNGCDLAGFTTQASFLLECGILAMAEKLEVTLSEIEKFHLHQAIKMLTLPTDMGERVKVMALSKNVALSLTGFHWQDRRREL